MLKRQDFAFELPEDLIAKHPPTARRDSRLLRVDAQQGSWEDDHFSQLPDLLQPGDLLVLNNTKVIPARLFGRKESGGKLDILIERILGESEALAHIRSSKSPKPGSRLILDEGVYVEVSGRQDALFELLFSEPLLPLLDRIGHIPLPPYIDRPDHDADRDRYQTVYATEEGAVAAPTAGLHFDESMLEQLQGDGIEIAYITLHVGAGTFQPVRVDNIADHQMHREYYEISAETAAQIEATRDRNGRVVAVGTTVVRTLESAVSDGLLCSGSGDTDIFITPGYRFQVVDAMLTNFHLSESTLIMLVSAFAGYQTTMAAYQHAIQQRYRFFSYGDAMYIVNRIQD